MSGRNNSPHVRQSDSKEPSQLLLILFASRFPCAWPASSPVRAAGSASSRVFSPDHTWSSGCLPRMYWWYLRNALSNAARVIALFSIPALSSNVFCSQAEHFLLIELPPFHWVRLRGSDQPLLCKAHYFKSANHQVVQQPDINAVERVTQSSGQCNISPAGLGVTAGVVVSDDHRSGVRIKNRLYHLPGIDAGAVDGAVEQLFEAQHPMLAIQQDYREYLAFLRCQLGLKVAPDHRGVGQIVTAFEACFEDGLRPLQYVQFG